MTAHKVLVMNSRSLRWIYMRSLRDCGRGTGHTHQPISQTHSLTLLHQISALDALHILAAHFHKCP